MQLTYFRVATTAWLTCSLVDISLQISDFSVYYETHNPRLISLLWHLSRCS